MTSLSASQILSQILLYFVHSMMVLLYFNYVIKAKNVGSQETNNRTRTGVGLHKLSRINDYVNGIQARGGKNIGYPLQGSPEKLEIQ